MASAASGLIWWARLFSLMNHFIYFALFANRLVVLGVSGGLEAGVDGHARQHTSEAQLYCRVVSCDPEPVILNMNIGTELFAQANPWMPSTEFFYWYMNLEGVLHLFICTGAAVSCFGGVGLAKRWFGASLYFWALVSELIIMDIYYFVVYTVCLLSTRNLIDLVLDERIRMAVGVVSRDLAVSVGDTVGFIIFLSLLNHASIFYDVGAFLVERIARSEQEVVAKANGKKRK